MPAFFNNTLIQLYSFEEGEYDDYGRKNNYSLKGEYSADIQPLSPQSSQQIFGKILQDTYKMYLNSNVPIEDTDIVKIPGEGTFEIFGSVETWNHGLINHKKVTLQKQRKELI
ncbi:MAG: hypothetical protein IJQ68_10375 [Methanobrevibacter sp.]|uniref:hypothetical protein n=1 Tax=Methanobrevibacter sp. TaxID=66852 RepID=UPI0025ED7772|nr:hypothetical protein [Methanobrevibacter sp.]MBR0272372.1 hypothetical protein [Methanobrevibacter sp.]